MKNPTFAKKYSKDFEYIAKINRHKFKKNEIVVINIEIKSPIPTTTSTMFHNCLPSAILKNG